mgnify:CR=1 FL=1
MKKRMIVLLALLLLGCAASDPNAVFVDPNAVRGGAYGALYFESNGTQFGIYDETEQVLSNLPEEIAAPYAETSCAFDGEDVVHFFRGFEITANEIDGVSRITAIRVTDDTVKTPQGLCIGMSEPDAAAAFPALAAGEWTLKDGTALLTVGLRDGEIISILYSPSDSE